jgi:hypothetical protein
VVYPPVRRRFMTSLTICAVLVLRGRPIRWPAPARGCRTGGRSTNPVQGRQGPG